MCTTFRVYEMIFRHFLFLQSNSRSVTFSLTLVLQSLDHACLLCLTAPAAAAAAGRLGAVHLPLCVLLQPGTPRGGLLLARPDQAASRSAAQHPLSQPVF